MFGYIYSIIDHYNHKIYIGQSTNINEVKNYFGSGIIIKRISKTRKHHLQKIILGYCETKEELDEAERICIEHFKSNDKLYGYNLSEGGEGNNYWLGKKFSNEHKMKISISNKGKNNPNKGHYRGKKLNKIHKNKIKNSLIGHEMSEKTKRKISETNKIKSAGKLNGMYGKNHSNETKMKISESQKKRLRSKIKNESKNIS